MNERVWGVGLIFLCVWVIPFGINQLTAGLLLDEEGLALHRASLTHVMHIIHLNDEHNLLPMDKYMSSPWLAYAGHIFPAVVWPICVVIQFLPRIRRDYPSFHRGCGYLLLLCSALISISSLLMVYHSDLAYRHGDFSKEINILRNPFTITLWTFPIVCTFVYYGYQAWRSIAILRSVRLHEQNMVIHVAIGLSVSLMRVMMLILAFLLQYLFRLDEAILSDVDFKQDVFSGLLILAFFINIFAANQYNQQKDRSYNNNVNSNNKQK